MRFVECIKVTPTDWLVQLNISVLMKRLGIEPERVQKAFVFVVIFDSAVC
jgi:hypothetical protein